MGDRNCNRNKYNPFVSQNYGFRQYQQQTMPYFPNASTQGGGFTVNTSMPVYDAGSSFNKASNLGMQPPQSNSRYDERPPPSYEESHRDTLLSRSKTDNRYPPSWNCTDETGGEKQNPQNSSFSGLFDIPEQAEAFQKSPDWSSDNYNSSQSYHPAPRGRLNPHDNFSHQPPTTFSSDYGSRSDYRFSQNNQRGFGKQDQNWGRKRGFRGRGYRQNKRKQSDGSWQGLDRSARMERDVQHSQHQRNLETPVSEDFGGGRDVEFDERERGSDDEGNEEDRDGNDGAFEKDNVYIPDPSLVTKYEYYPPSAEEMGEMFKDLVIHFFFKLRKNKKERNPFVVICEAFRKSTGYCNIEVEDGYDIKVKDRKFCTLRYRGMMLVRGVGENNNLKEPRVFAGVNLINKLAMSCYTLKSKGEYFTASALEQMRLKGSVPGVYTIAPQEEAHDFNSARNYLQSMFANEDSDVEFIFHLPDNKEAITLKIWANKQHPKFEVRTIKGEWLGIHRHRSPQYWRDKILASGAMENEKFILTPPQGIGNRLLNNFKVKEVVPHLKARRYLIGCLENVYGPPGVGPQISKALPPWDRNRGNSRRNKTTNKKKRIVELVQQGTPLTEVKHFRHLSKRQKRIIKKELGQ